MCQPGLQGKQDENTGGWVLTPLNFPFWLCQHQHQFRSSVLLLVLLAKSELGLICGQLTWQEALPACASYKVSSSSCRIPKHSSGRGQSGSGALIWVSRSSRGRQLVPAFGAVPAGSGLLGQLCHIKQVPALEQHMKKPTRISSSEFVNEEICFRDCLVWINLCGLGSYKGFKHLFSPRLWGLIIPSALPSRHF